MQPQQPPTVPAATPPTYSPDENGPLSRVTWYAILNLVAVLVGFGLIPLIVGPMASIVESLHGATVTSSGPSPQQIQAMTSLFQDMLLFVPAILLLGITSTTLLWTGFKGLSKAGARELSLPSKLTLVFLIGEVILLVGVFSFLSMIVPFMASLAGTSASSPAFSTGPAIGSLALSGLGWLLTIIGLIGGAILGLWRVGGRYGQGTLKAGAVFTIIPFLSIVSPILVIVGISGAKKKVTGAQAMPPR